MLSVIEPAVILYPHISKTTAVERIESIGRVCYKSERNITEGSAETFVTSLIKRGHDSVLEHANFCLEVDTRAFAVFVTTLENLEFVYGFKSFLRCTNIVSPLISGNARAWRNFFRACVNTDVEIPGFCSVLIKSEPLLFSEWLDYHEETAGEPIKVFDTSTLTNHVEQMVHHDITVKFICDRGVSHEFVRHRVGSFSQESTRYCNYSGSLGVIDIASAFHNNDNANNSLKHEVWGRAVAQAAENYSELIALGAKPDEARCVLPNSTKTEVVITMNGSGWHNFDKLRSSNAAHPQARELARKLHSVFEEKYPWLLKPLKINGGGKH